MTRSKPSLLNSAKPALFLKILFILLFISGCSTSTTPTFTRKQIASSIVDICKKEYKLDVKARLAGKTVWVYYPVRNMIVKSAHPREITEYFDLDEDSLVNSFGNRAFILEYGIKKIHPTTLKDDTELDKNISNNIGDIWKVIRRIIFSLEHNKETEPRFYCLVVADITNGFTITFTTYYLDLKKVSYGLISTEEFQHRTLQEINKDPRIIDDTVGRYMENRDISMREFVARQVLHRIKLAFGKPEAGKNIDIDNEIIRIFAYTIKIYNFGNFKSVEFKNIVNHKELLLNKVAIMERAKDYGF